MTNCPHTFLRQSRIYRTQRRNWIFAMCYWTTTRWRKSFWRTENVRHWIRNRDQLNTCKTSEKRRVWTPIIVCFCFVQIKWLPAGTKRTQSRIFVWQQTSLPKKQIPTSNPKNPRHSYPCNIWLDEKSRFYQNRFSYSHTKRMWRNNRIVRGRTRKWKKNVSDPIVTVIHRSGYFCSQTSLRFRSMFSCWRV